MICQACGIHQANSLCRLRQDGKERELAVCAHCLEQLERGESLTSQPSNSGGTEGGIEGQMKQWLSGEFGLPLSSSFFGNSLLFPGLTSVPSSQPRRLKPPGGRCAHCGSTFASYQQTGIFGCPHCYQQFRPLLDRQLLPQQQRGIKNVGRAYGQASKWLAHKRKEGSECPGI